MQIKFILKCIQYMTRSALRTEQFTFGVNGQTFCIIYWGVISHSSVAWTTASRLFFASGIQKFADR